jgi:hypothetical protein
MSAIILVGNISDGFSAVGPFATFDAAAAWSESNDQLKQGTWIMPLEPPADAGVRPSMPCEPTTDEYFDDRRAATDPAYRDYIK